MKKFIIPALAVALFSCNGNKATEAADDNNADATEQAAPASLAGQWRLTDYPGENEVCEMDSTENYILAFNPEDNTFGMETDCNNVFGQYAVSGDSIKFDNVGVTRMACPEEKIERAMAAILPMVDTYAVTPDSVLILRSDARTMARFEYVK